MKYCSNCGNTLNDEDKFCAKCGTKCSCASETSERRIKYEGDVHKCPNCGEIIEAFIFECPSCGYEFRNVEAANSVKELEKKIGEIEKTRTTVKTKPLSIWNAAVNDKATETDIKIINLIKSYPIPNTKEDIMEFMVLAFSNIDYDSYDQFRSGVAKARQEVSGAWIAKMEQAYQKAKIVCINEPEFDNLEKLYIDANKRIKSNRYRIWKILGIAWLILIILIFLEIKFI